MDAYEREQWKLLDERLAEAEKRLKATASLVQAGIPMVVDAQMKINALIDSDARLYLRLQQLSEEIATVQKRTDEQLDRLAVSVQKLATRSSQVGTAADEPPPRPHENG